MADIDLSELVARFVLDGGSVTHLLEAGAAVANAIAMGAGPMIRGTFMESDFRNALKLKPGERVNFGRSKEARRG